MLGSIELNDVLFAIDKEPKVADNEVSNQSTSRSIDWFPDNHFSFNGYLGKEFLKIQERFAFVLASNRSSASHTVILFYKRGKP